MQGKLSKNSIWHEISGLKVWLLVGMGGFGIAKSRSVQLSGVEAVAADCYLLVGEVVDGGTEVVELGNHGGLVLLNPGNIKVQRGQGGE